MKTYAVLFTLLVATPTMYAQEIPDQPSEKVNNSISAFRDTLIILATGAQNDFLRMHFESMLAVIDAKTTYSHADSLFLETTFNAFNNEADNTNPKRLSTYLERRRPLILAWESPTDGTISFSQLKPPVNWDPEVQYPLYIQLHGLWDEASNTIQYMTYPFRNGPSSGSSYEDGYLLSPWGRGNLWYQGISETDIWECIAALENIVEIDPTRKYITGHSMGGYGAWHIAQRSESTWAALGVHAGALWYNSSEVNEAAAETLRNMPTYFVCGTNDGLLSINETAYQLLQNAGNTDIEFVTFVGGHEYVEQNVTDMYLWIREFVNEDYISVENEPEELTKISLNTYPNPFSTKTKISFKLEKQADILIEIYTITGQLVGSMQYFNLLAGEHEIQWEPVNLPNGIYNCLFKSGPILESIRIECLS
jgi:hypothetical protein